MSPRLEQPAILHALTSLRFVLALGVVVFHYQLNMLPAGEPPIALIERARLGVDVFFILSGFVLAHVYAHSYQFGRFNYRRFLVARLARIYPAHLAILLAMALVALIAQTLNQPFEAERYSLPGWLASLALVHAWWPWPIPNEWNGPSWSLSAEWAAYLAFPLFAFLGLRRGRVAWRTIALSAVLFIWFDELYRGLYGQILTHAESALGVLRLAPEFLFGIGLEQLSRRIRITPKISVWAASGAAASMVALMSISADERLIVAVSGVMVLTLALLSKHERAGVLAHPMAIEAGEASYALYLVHLPLLTIWKNGLAMLLGVDSSYIMAPWEGIALLGLTLAAAVLLHRCWERPARAWIRSRFLRDPRPVPPPSPTER